METRVSVSLLTRRDAGTQGRGEEPRREAAWAQRQSRGRGSGLCVRAWCVCVGGGGQSGRAAELCHPEARKTHDREVVLGLRFSSVVYCAGI